jgi:hypothetical protein
LRLSTEKADPGALVRLVWLDSLPDLARPDLPVEDLLGWLVTKHPSPNTSDILAGFSRLVFHCEFSAAFTDRTPRAYATQDGELAAPPVTLTAV